MEKKYNIIVGDKVDLFLGGSRYYRSSVEDKPNEKSLYVSIPTYRGASVALRENQRLKLYYCRENGRYCVEVQVKSIGSFGNVPVAEVEIIYAPRREQRRLSYRVQTRVKAVIYPPADSDFDPDMDEYGNEKETAYTRDLSESGASLVTKDRYLIGEELLIRLYLPNKKYNEYSVALRARVRRESYDEARDIYRIGLEFIDITEPKRTVLSKYIFAQQKHLLQQKRLVNGE